MNALTKVFLIYESNSFHLKTQNDVILWSGRYHEFDMALEFARAYMSNMQQTTLCLEDGLRDKFYECKRKNDLLYLFDDEDFYDTIDYYGE